MAQGKSNQKKQSPKSSNGNTRKSTGSTSRGKTNSSQGNAVRASTNKKKHNPFADEVTLVVTAVISILLVLSNMKLGGMLSDFVNDITFGLMGGIARVFPIFLFLGVSFGISNRKNHKARQKLICVVGIIIIITALLQMVSYPDLHMSDMLDSYKLCASNKNGGGLIGGIISTILVNFVGKIGAYVVLIALAVILFTFTTEIFIFSILKNKGVQRIHEIRERRKYQIGFEEEEEDSLAIYESGQFPKRRAKTFTFDRKAVVESNAVEGEMNGSSNGVKEIFNSRKNKKKKEANSIFDGCEESKEIEITIQRANPVNASSQVPFEHEEVFEQEMKRKFNSEIQEISEENSMTFDEIVSKDELQNEDIMSSLTLEPEANPFMDENGQLEQEPTLYVDTKRENSHSSEGKHGEEIPYIKKDPNLKETYHNEFRKSKISQAEEALEAIAINKEITMKSEPIKKYEFPPIDLLGKPKVSLKGMSDRELKDTALKLQSTLESFGVRVTITNVSCGPAVTRYELQPEQGVKVSRITNLADDIKLNLAAADIRIEAPIPGKAAVGIEVPNKVNSMVTFRELIESKEFKEHQSDIAFAVGKDIGGQTVVTDIAKMPHLLIAGATGSGKSVCINTLIMSILYKASPEDVKLIMVDPKVVELSVYNGIPHLLIPVVTDPKKASAALNWAVAEMTDRYKKFADLGVRDIKGYNKKIESLPENEEFQYQKLPQIVIIVDELADLMMVAPGEVEDAICRLAQMARAAGLHLIIATQRPSVNVITGLIKANVPSRIAFSVSSAIDSRTILDGAGAEKLLGKGDMLFFPSGYPKPVRIQGAFVSDKEVGSVVEFLTEQNTNPVTNSELEGKITSAVSSESSSAKTSSLDEYFAEAGKFIIDKDKASIGMLQRVFKIGFNRAARIMDQLYEAGVVGPEEGTKPRKVLMSIEEFEQYIDEYV